MFKQCFTCAAGALVPPIQWYDELFSFSDYFAIDEFASSYNS